MKTLASIVLKKLEKYKEYVNMLFMEKAKMKELEKLFKEYNLLGNGFIKTPTLAKICNVSLTTVRNWIRKNKLNAVMFGDDYYIKKRDAREFIARNFFKIDDYNEEEDEVFKPTTK